MASDFALSSTWLHPDRLHVGMIMDGNGRWARTRALPRWAGHAAGVRTVRRIVRGAPGLGVGTLTLYAFSADNWKRPHTEVEYLMQLLTRYLREEIETCRENSVRLNVIGRRERLTPALQHAIITAESATAEGTRLLLRLAVDYSARRAIAATARRLHAQAEPPDAEAFDAALGAAVHSVPDVRSVDLIIRTSGEQRLSDFLLWESAYAEFYFTPTPWPDFRMPEFRTAIHDFNARERRFGALSSSDPVTTRSGGTP